MRTMGPTGASTDGHVTPGLWTVDDEARTRAAVARAREGDMDALQWLYVRYADRVFRSARSVLGDADAAQDVTQTVFVKLMTRLDRYEQREAPFGAWLARVTRYAALDHLRRQRAAREAALPDDGERLAADDGGGEHRRSLSEALGQLPHAQAEVVVLRHVVGLTPSEIAVRLHRTESSVHNLHNRARRTLRVRLRGLDAVPTAMR
jgi:RNA polymerase sigma-70 factor (ECF subfamily)